MALINDIIIHCADTPNGRKLARNGKTAAQIIDKWHAERGFHRNINNKLYFNRDLDAIGYQFVIDIDGTLNTGRNIGEVGAHCKGHNTGSVGICLVGYDKFTAAQWAALKQLVAKLRKDYPQATLHGHRDYAPRVCPGFNVADWVKNGFEPLTNHITAEVA
jgi:putative N-acetylmuramoyl-L-alanine amidase|nr:MAG TPA: endodeoxyribonuclease I [Caudoviricetes sp.]